MDFVGTLKRKLSILGLSDKLHLSRLKKLPGKKASLMRVIFLVSVGTVF